MAATKGYLVELLSIEAFYGPGLTVEQAIKLEKHERFLESGGYCNSAALIPNAPQYKKESGFWDW